MCGEASGYTIHPGTEIICIRTINREHAAAPPFLLSPEVSYPVSAKLGLEFGRQFLSFSWRPRRRLPHIASLANHKFFHFPKVPSVILLLSCPGYFVSQTDRQTVSQTARSSESLCCTDSFSSFLPPPALSLMGNEMKLFNDENCYF